MEGMELCGEGEAEPPAGSMRVRLMRHQRLALHWMRAREAAAANPRGGILADDQAWHAEELTLLFCQGLYA